MLLSDTTKGSLEKLIGEMAKKDSELREVKKLCTLTPLGGESKDEGQLNYTIKHVFVLITSSTQSACPACDRQIILF